MSRESKFGRIGILMGGPSTEREISLKSGKAVYESLSKEGCSVVPIDIVSDDIPANARLLKLEHLDCIFLALHGHFGEDGILQGLLDNLKIPYTGSGAIASRLAMDKIASREIFDAHGLATPRYVALDQGLSAASLQRISELRLPLVVKPATHGSSIGLSIVDRREDLEKAIEFAFSYDSHVLVDEYIHGKELTVAILDNKALPVIEIIPTHRFFDFEAKYKPGLTQYRVPAQIDESLVHKVQDVALSAHNLLGCYGCSRVDIILTEDHIPFVLEVNTIPGLTETSLLPKAAWLTGMGFNQLCTRLLELAYEKVSQVSGVSF
ncbi:MAG: D-alanine--D-alanine ligase [Candidatus Omnitrophota bacterium]|jgi:D-alanine-D-alanine ligase